MKEYTISLIALTSCLLITMTGVVFGFSIAGAVIAAQHPSSCSSYLMDTDTWLMVAADTDLAMIGGVIVAGFIGAIMMANNCEGIGLCMMGMGYLAIFLYSLFNIVWFIIGIVQLVEVTATCKTEAQTLWIMTIIYVVWKLLTIISGVSTIKEKNWT